GMGRAGQDKELGTLRAQILDRSRQEAVAPQRARDCPRQQACPHRLGGAGQRPRLRADEDRRCRRPTRLILAPCSARSRRSLATPEPAASKARRPALTVPCARRDRRSVGRDEGTALGSNKGTAQYEEQVMT